MIVPMKKTVVLCLADDRQQTLDKLGELGVVHVESAPKEESKSRVDLQKLYADVNKITGVLSGRIVKGKKSPAKKLSGEEAYKQSAELLAKRDETAKQHDLYTREIEQLRPWGEFSRETIAELKQRGIFVYLCFASDKELNTVREAQPEAIIKIIHGHKGRHYFALVSEKELNAAELPLAQVPERSLSEAQNLAKQAHKEIAHLDKELDGMTAELPAMQEYFKRVTEELEFSTAFDSMESHGAVVSLRGFVPEPDVDKLKLAAMDHGWALLLQDPDYQEPVPTLVNLPKWLTYAKLVLEFVGVSQGYREADVSACFLFFFTIFFGMIVGDAGYGAIFLVISLLFAFKVGNSNKKMHNIAKLCIQLSCASLIFGLLSGNVFAIESEHMPRFLRGIDFLTNKQHGDDNLKWLCFFIAMVHLGLARLWRTLLATGWRQKINEIGWACLLIGNFYTASAMIAGRAFPEWVFTLYLAGLVFTLVGLNWKEVGDIFNYPFGVIGTFTDTLSYIRLYAVGLSGVYIARSFNDMGRMIYEIPVPGYVVPLLFIGAALIILAGHLLNMALAMMGVLVHGIRLNTLEFSTHMGLQWAGFTYKPLKKTIEDKTQKGD